MQYQRKIFVETIRELYKKADLTREQLQKKVETETPVSFDAIRSCLNDEFAEPLPVQLLCAFSELFNCTLDQLLGGKPVPQQKQAVQAEQEFSLISEERELIDLFRQLQQTPQAQHIVMQLTAELNKLTGKSNSQIV